MSNNFLFTSESVSEGHPDKVADRLSDTVLDAYLAADPYSRVACVQQDSAFHTLRRIDRGVTERVHSATPETLRRVVRPG